MIRKLNKIDIKDLEDHLQSAIQEDRKYWLQNETKLKAVHDHVETYEKFKELVNAAHLKPLDKTDKLKREKFTKTIWNKFAEEDRRFQAEEERCRSVLNRGRHEPFASRNKKMDVNIEEGIDPKVIESKQEKMKRNQSEDSNGKGESEVVTNREFRVDGGVEVFGEREVMRLDGGVEATEEGEFGKGKEFKDDGVEASEGGGDRKGEVFEVDGGVEACEGTIKKDKQFEMNDNISRQNFKIANSLKRDEFMEILRTNEQQLEFLRAFKASTFVEIFQNDITANELIEILKALSKFDKSSVEDIAFVVEFLEQMNNIERFALTLSFLSSNEKAIVEKLFEKLYSCFVLKSELLKKIDLDEDVLLALKIIYQL